MAKKPTPRKEIVATDIDVYIEIVAITPDARGWIESEARDYGVLYKSTLDDNTYSFFVDPNWDKQEVITYLESGGK